MHVSDNLRIDRKLIQFFVMFNHRRYHAGKHVNIRNHILVEQKIYKLAEMLAPLILLNQSSTRPWKCEHFIVPDAPGRQELKYLIAHLRIWVLNYEYFLRFNLNVERTRFQNRVFIFDGLRLLRNHWVYRIPVIMIINVPRSERLVFELHSLVQRLRLPPARSFLFRVFIQFVVVFPS